MVPMIATAPATPDAAGKLIHDYAAEKGMSDVEAYAYIIAKNRGDVSDIRFLMNEEDLPLRQLFTVFSPRPISLSNAASLSNSARIS